MSSSKFNGHRAILAQKILSRRVIRSDMIEEPIKYIMGLDVSYAGEFGIAACTIFSNDLKLLRFKIIVDKVKIPYIPGLLAFRELPLYARLCLEFKGRRDIVVLVDGHGLAHPRRLGIASHLGVTLSIPTVGVAKRILIGKPVVVNGDRTLLVDRGEIVGEMLKVKGKPIIVSIGHMVSLKRAVEIVKKVTLKYRIPEPIRLAHIISKSVAENVKRKLQRASKVKR